jgi:hypothetical protein
MQPLTGTIHDGRIMPDGPIDWPEGTRVEIIPQRAPAEKIGLEEAEWRDDPEALADWEAWIKTIEPLELTPEERTERTRFREEMRRFNVEAVRRQMEEGPAP